MTKVNKFKRTIKRMCPRFILSLNRKRKCFEWWKNFRKERESIVDTIIDYYKGNDTYADEICYLRKKGADYFPYKWNQKRFVWGVKTGRENIMEGADEYVIRNGKKLYVELEAYSQLILEQNAHSPHAYFSKDFYVQEGDCFVDAGAAEGLISLDVMNRASKIFLIECNQKWCERLKETFKEYREKVEIIEKYVSDIDDEKNITLDNMLKDITQPIFLKIDVEGMEHKVLEGAKEVLSRPSTRVAVCTYHKPNDADVLKKYVEEYGFCTEFSEGYMAMVNEVTPPYFRKGVLRAWKQHTKK